MDLYVHNEEYDGYIRDNCLFRNEINIYDKMSAQVKYKNDVVLNYSLTTYSPFEGWRVAFNGTEGRLEARLDIPYEKSVNINQAEMHANEMDQTSQEEDKYEPIFVHKLWKDYEVVKVPFIGIAARKSIESGEPIKIAELTELQPREKRL